MHVLTNLIFVFVFVDLTLLSDGLEFKVCQSDNQCPQRQICDTSQKKCACDKIVCKRYCPEGKTVDDYQCQMCQCKDEYFGEEEDDGRFQKKNHDKNEDTDELKPKFVRFGDDEEKEDEVKNTKELADRIKLMALLQDTESKK